MSEYTHMEKIKMSIPEMVEILEKRADRGLCLDIECEARANKGLDCCEEGEAARVLNEIGEFLRISL